MLVFLQAFAGFLLVAATEFHPFIEWQIDLFKGQSVEFGDSFFVPPLIGHRFRFHPILDALNLFEFCDQTHHSSLSKNCIAH